MMKLHRYFQTAAITFSLIFGTSAPAFCQSPQNTPASPAQIQKVIDQIQKIGIDKDVTVILYNDIEFYGTIRKIDSDSFEIDEVDLHQKVTIEYKDVRQVREGYGAMNPSSGKRNNRRTMLIVGIAGTAALVGLTLWGISKTSRIPQPRRW